MEPTLLEEIEMLSFDEERGTHVPLVPGALAFALAGALICDFERLGALHIEEDTIYRSLDASTVPAFLQPFLEKIQGRGTVRYWILKLADEKGALEKAALDALLAKGVLEHKDKRLLRIFHIHRYPSAHHGERLHARDRLRHALNGGEADAFDTSLLAILAACGLLPEVLPSESIDEKRVDQIVATHPVARLVKDETRTALEEILRVQGMPPSPFSI